MVEAASIGNAVKLTAFFPRTCAFTVEQPHPGMCRFKHFILSYHRQAGPEAPWTAYI